MDDDILKAFGEWIDEHYPNNGVNNIAILLAAFKAGHNHGYDVGYTNGIEAMEMFEGQRHDASQIF